MVSSTSAPAGAPYTGTLPADVQSNAAVKTEAVTPFSKFHFHLPPLSDCLFLPGLLTLFS